MTTQKTETANLFLSLLQALGNPLKKDNQLANPVFWKKLQQLVHVLIGIVPFLGFVFPQYKLLLDVSMLGSLEAALGTLAAYLTVATTGKLGL